MVWTKFYPLRMLSHVLYPLGLGIDRLAAGVGDAVPEVFDDVLEPPFKRPRHLDHGSLTSPCRQACHQRKYFLAGGS